MSNEEFLHRHLEAQIRNDMDKAELPMDKNFYLFLLDVSSRIDSLIDHQDQFISSLEKNPAIKLGSLIRRHPKIMALVIPSSLAGILYSFFAKNADSIKALLGL